MNHPEFRVNKETGEIIGKYTASELAPMTTEEKQYYKYSNVNPELATNLDQLTDYIKVSVDKRKLVTYSATKHLHDSSCGAAVRGGGKAMFTLPQYKLLNKLIKALVYRNIVIGTKVSVAKKLGVEPKNLKRTLEVLDSLVVVQDVGMSKGQIKILINPSYGFRYESDTINSARMSCERSWLKRKETYTEQMQRLMSPNTVDQTQKEVVFSPEFDVFLSAFSKGIKKKNDNFKKDEEGNLILPNTF
jgi:hypothetical protein